MWFAAQNTYLNEPWLLSLTHRLLLGRPEVLALLDRNHSPFVQKSPKYIRASLYTYKYTLWNQRYSRIRVFDVFNVCYIFFYCRSQQAWWKREKQDEYFPAFTKDSPTLIDYLKARNLLPVTGKSTVNPLWKQILDSIRYITNQFEATLLIWSVLTAGCAIITTTSTNKA